MMKKQVFLIYMCACLCILVSCSANKIDSDNDSEVKQHQEAEAETEAETDTVSNEEQEPAEQEEAIEETSEMEEEWIESIEEQNARKWKSNGEIEVSIVRTSKPVIGETGEVLANAYYDRPVVSGDSEAAKKINRFFEQEERDWLEGEAGRLTGYYEDYYLDFCNRVAFMCEMYGEEVIAGQPLRYTIDSRIMFLSDELLSVLQIETYFSGKCNWHYFGSTFDLKTGELIPIDALVDMTPGNMRQIVGDAGDMYDVLDGENYEVDYETDNHRYTIAMNYEYYYDGNHYFIIVNQGEGSMMLWVDGEIREWNGEWGEKYKVSKFQYRVDLQNERWEKSFY